MTRVLFVCYGNICRSPMAEFVFKKMVADRGLSDEFLIESRATSSEEIIGGVGRPIYPPARNEMRRQGIPFEERRATLLLPSDAEKYDIFLGMDDDNIRNMKRILGTGVEIHRLLDLTDRGGEVADPWYTDRFDIAYRDIRDGCAALLEYLLKKAD